MSVAIVDYGSGNLRSAAKGFEKFLSTPVVVTADATEVACADRIV
ncbi:MAG: imidazole glycerol phosphate synthase subunit HisH, partial [Pseudomonadota bacterium]|nr:imidazole glycerol phosphate synthase subunit HisH [Pseudomonadota bacterium]